MNIANILNFERTSISKLGNKQQQKIQTYPRSEYVHCISKVTLQKSVKKVAYKVSLLFPDYRNQALLSLLIVSYKIQHSRTLIVSTDKSQTHKDKDKYLISLLVLFRA